MSRLPTRRVAAADLIRQLQRGPAVLSSDGGHLSIPKHHREQALEQYRLWVDTWVIPVIKRLVKEAR